MATPRALTLNTEQHILLHIVLERNIDRGQDLYIFKIVINMGIQGVLAQTSYPAGTIQ